MLSIMTPRHSKQRKKRFICKVAIAGSSTVGKTTLLYRYERNRFIPALKTIGVDFIAKEIIVDKKYVTLAIWDFAGEEKFLELFPAYCAGSRGGLVCFDTSTALEIDLMENLSPWIQILREVNSDIPLLLVGNKIDLLSSDSQLDEITEKVQPIIKKFNFKGLRFTSAFDGRGVNEVFFDIAKLMTMYPK